MHGQQNIKKDTAMRHIKLHEILHMHSSENLTSHKRYLITVKF